MDESTQKSLQPLIEAIGETGTITFGLQPNHIKLIEDTIKQFGGAHPYVFEKVGKQISWCPKTLACYYINHLLGI